ncbi:hypothetical protein FACS1894137_16600 [Spirochaetia bacterium]|nr:hypothetical protein FACS1894137_16600 [Spirochaetia bacterium]
MCREQKTKQGELDFGCPREDRVEPEGPEGARSIGARKTMDGDSVGGRKPDGNLLEQVLTTKNMFDACERVIRNLPRVSVILSSRSRRNDG